MVRKKKIISMILFLVVFISSFVSLNFIVGANSVTVVSVDAGVVNARISFTCSDGSDHIRIYYDDVAGITTGDTSTYIDPDNTNYSSGRTSRWMMILGLEPDTTYYYRIYAVSEGWASNEGSFTTKSRFTDVWKDSFYDEYLIEDSNDLTIEQQTGTRYVGNPVLPVQTYDGYTIIGYGYPTVFADGGKYHMFTRDFKSQYNNTDCFAYFTSNNGLTWGTKKLLDVGVATRSIVPAGFINISGTYYFVTKGSGTDANPRCMLVNSTSYDSGWSVVNGNMVEYLTGASEHSLASFVNDTLGTTYKTCGQSYVGAGRVRQCGPFYFNPSDLTDVLYFQPSYTSGHYSIPGVEGDAGADDNVYMDSEWIDAGTYVKVWSEYADDTLELWLSVSRNGWDGWETVETSTPFLNTGGAGSWDDGMMYPGRNGPITIGDNWYYFYSAWDGDHSSTPRRENTGILVFRKDGFTAYEPSSASAWFRTVEIPSAFRHNFTVNFDGTASGLEIAVYNSGTGLPYAGFNFGDFNTITIDSTHHVPMWGTKTLNDIPSGDFKLNFSWTANNGELFSYTIYRTEDLQFISIDGLGNASTIFDSTPIFIWTKITGASRYQLQISTSSSFAILTVNLLDINEMMFPVEYSEGTEVQFELPLSYKLTAGGVYYCRVRAFVKT